MPSKSVPPPTVSNSSHDHSLSEKGSGNESSGSLSTLVMRRRRAQLSCVRCHRLKVGCDRKQPFTRCGRAGWGRQCTYNHRVESGAAANDQAGDVGDDTAHTLSAWHAHRHGPSHWKILVSTVSEIILPSISHTYEEAATNSGL